LIGERVSGKEESILNIRFYTFPPKRVYYPYLLVNPRNYKALFKKRFEHAILDCGVEFFKHNPDVKDYPRSFIESWKIQAKQLTKIFEDKLWIVIPDYPDDFNPGQFGDNVNKTIRNIEEFIAVDGVDWIVSLQSRYLDPFSFFESCERVRELVGDYPRIAVGTVCKTNNLDFIEYCCMLARHFFPKSWIHAFGLTLKALPRIKTPSGWLINSFDSLAYTFPRTPGRSSCRNSEERKQFFHAYLERLKHLINQSFLEGGFYE